MNSEQAREFFAYTDGTQKQTEQCIAVRKPFVEAAVACCENIESVSDRIYALRKVKDALQAAIGGIVAPMPKR